VDEFSERRSRQKLERAIDTLMRDLDHLSSEDRDKARMLLEQRFSTPTRSRGKRTPRKGDRA